MDEMILNAALTWAINFASSHPAFASALMLIGFLRLSVKPLMTIAQNAVKLTPYDSDDKWLASFEQSKGYKLLVYALDWFLSVKLPEKTNKPQ